MKSIGAEFLRPDALPGVNHMREIQYQIILNITFWPELIQLYIFVCRIPTQDNNINLHYKLPFSHILRHTWVKAMMLFYSYITRYYYIIYMFLFSLIKVKQS